MKTILELVLCIALSFQTQASENANEVFYLINQRLSYMQDVALFKAQNHLAIEDIDREKVIIRKAKSIANNQGLDSDSIEQFFKIQISLAKIIQYRYRADFLTSLTPLVKTKDLTKVVRPMLIRLGKDIITKISLYIKHNGHFNPSQLITFKQAINDKYLIDSEKKILFLALLKIQSKK